MNIIDKYYESWYRSIIFELEADLLEDLFVIQANTNL